MEGVSALHSIIVCMLCHWSTDDRPASLTGKTGARIPTAAPQIKQ
jgi:predicted metal-binding protein